MENGQKSSLLFRKFSQQKVPCTGEEEIGDLEKNKGGVM